MKEGVWPGDTQCSRFQIVTIIPVLQNYSLLFDKLLWVACGKIDFFFLSVDFFLAHLFTLVKLASQRAPLKITLQKKKKRKAHHLYISHYILKRCQKKSSMDNCISAALSSYWRNGYVVLFFFNTAQRAKNVSKHFMQDEPASSRSKHSNMFQVQVSFWYCFTVKGTTDVN